MTAERSWRSFIEEAERLIKQDAESAREVAESLAVPFADVKHLHWFMLEVADRVRWGTL